MELSGVIGVESCQADASSQHFIPSWVGCTGHKRVGEGVQSSVLAAGTQRGVGRARGISRGRCRVPKPHSDALEGTLVMERSDNMRRSNIRHTWKVLPASPKREAGGAAFPFLRTPKAWEA